MKEENILFDITTRQLQSNARQSWNQFAYAQHHLDVRLYIIWLYIILIPGRLFGGANQYRRPNRRPGIKLKNQQPNKMLYIMLTNVRIDTVGEPQMKNN